MGQCAFVVVFAGPRCQDDAGLVEVHGQADASQGILKFWPKPVCLGLVLETEEHVISKKVGFGRGGSVYIYIYIYCVCVSMKKAYYSHAVKLFRQQVPPRFEFER